MKRIGAMAMMIVVLACITAVAQTVPEEIRKAKEAKVLTRANLDKKTGASSLSGLSGTWWRSPANVQFFNLTSDQQRKMDEVFQENRVRLITLDADLRVQEAMLEPLMAAERLDESKTLAQIDRVAQARAELEKANARMLLGIREVMTAEQRAMLQKRQSRTKP